MNHAEVTVRSAVPQDLSALCRLEETCFAVPWSEASLRHDLEGNSDACYRVACSADGQVVGYAAYWRAAGEGLITNIAVAAEYRGRRIGTLLLRALIEAAQSDRLTLLCLEVRTGNLPARHLYASAGFAQVGVRPGYYTDNGEDAIIMCKNLVL